MRNGSPAIPGDSSATYAELEAVDRTRCPA